MCVCVSVCVCVCVYVCVYRGRAVLTAPRDYTFCSRQKLQKVSNGDHGIILCYFPVFAKHLGLKQRRNRKEKVKAFHESFSFQSVFASQ